MSNRKSKKAVAVVTSLSMLANASPQINAIDQIAISQRIQNAFPPTFTNPLQPISKDFSINSIEEKINNVLNPVEKEEYKEAKLLVDYFSGECGDGVTYTLTVSTGELVISYEGYGTGEMTDYSFSSKSPWFLYRESIKSIVIENGVTKIGDAAFDHCYKLTSITIPSSVTDIYSSAFSGCSGLTSINVDTNNTSYKSIDGILYSYDGKTLLQCPAGKTGYISIPDSVNSIGSGAFSGCSGLTSITIPSSVTEIGSYEFSGCSGLTSVSLNNNYCVSNFKSAFPTPTYSNITSITIGNSVTSIGSDAFFGYSGLTSVTIGDSVTSIGQSAFEGCSGLTSITIPSSVTEIGFAAFRDCSGLTGQLTIPASVTSIGQSAFEGCSGLTSITIPSSVTEIGYYAFSGCSGLTSVTIPSSVTEIGFSAFSGCKGLTGQLTIPDSVNYIGDSAFKGCSGLTSVTIPASVTDIYSSAFSGCSGLTTVTYEGTFDPGAYSSDVFSGCSQLTAVNVPYNYKDNSFCGLSIKGKGSSNTAVIASTVSVAAAVVIAAVTAITCYFKNPSSFPCLRKSGNEASADVDPKV